MNLKNQEIATDPLCVYICMGYGMCAGEGGGGVAVQPFFCKADQSAWSLSLISLSVILVGREGGRIWGVGFWKCVCGPHQKGERISIYHKVWVFESVCLWTLSSWEGGGREDIRVVESVCLWTCWKCMFEDPSCSCGGGYQRESLNWSHVCVFIKNASSSLRVSVV